MKLAKIKQASAELGISEYTLRNMCRMEKFKPAIYRLTGGRTDPYRIDTEMFMKILRADK